MDAAALRSLAATLAIAVTACAQPKITETNWMHELERNSFEKKWTAFANSLTEPQAQKLGKVFITSTEAAIVDFESSLDDLRRLKFGHMVEAAASCEHTRREMAAKTAAAAASPQATPRDTSMFDRLDIKPGAPTHIPEPEEPAEPQGECLSPEDAYVQAFAEGTARKAANPLPAGRKDIEEICHRLQPFGFARYWRQRAREWCVTTLAVKGG